MSRRILYVCNDAAYFANHRGHVALRAAAEGWHVRVATGGDPFALDGRFDVVPLDIERLAVSPLRDMRAALAIHAAIDAFRADVVHLITMKPIVLAAAGDIFGRRRDDGRAPLVVATFPGLGRVFEDESVAGRLRRGVVERLLSRFFRRARAVATFENADDRDRLVSLGVTSTERALTLAGTGIDLERFAPAPLPQVEGRFRALWASRLIRGKGLKPFVDAARLARDAGFAIEFLVAGYRDPGHPDCLSDAEMAELRAEPSVRFLDHVTAMPELLRTVDALVLPSSYNEGLPRVLLEAAASGLPLVASDVPGCRVLVKENETGLVLQEESGHAILSAVSRLAADRGDASRMGQAARRLVEEGGFDNRSIQDAFLELYAQA